VRNSLKRTSLANPGDAAHWKAINALNNSPNNMGWVPEGRRAGSITYSAANKSATYASMGTEDSVTDEAKLAAVGFEDEEALIQMRSLYKLMTIEESGLLFGNNSLDLGTTPTPTLGIRRRHAAERHLLGDLRCAVGRGPRQRVGRGRCRC
jgi:hypothetical protein